MKIHSVGYTIFLEEASFFHLDQFLNEHTFYSLFIICDHHTKKHCLPLLLRKCNRLKKSKVYSISPGEKNKTLETIKNCWNFLLKDGADRQSLVISLGGGVVCDLAGFAASTFKRGIPFIHIPTSLLAMADASVGGKTGVDFAGYKNMIGTITQPSGVFIYEGFLKTLPQRHIQNAFAEIIKAALIQDAKLWKKILASGKLSLKGLSFFILGSVRVKNSICTKDPSEKNIRKILNFGHTVGHAVESHFLRQKNPLLHGEAIAMGMCVELCLGIILDVTHKKTVMEAFSYLKKEYTLLPFPPAITEKLLLLMKHDKKNSASQINFSLIEQVGKPLLNVTASESQIREAFYLYNSALA